MDAPRVAVQAADISADPRDLHARNLLGAHTLIGEEAAGGLEQFLEMLRLDRTFENGLPKKTLIDAFRTIADTDLVGTYRRKMSSLLF